MNSKPITDNMKQRCKIVYNYLYNKHDYCTKQELMELLDTGERQVRDIISTLSKSQPIIATSDQKGYKLAITVKDLDDVEHEIKELDSRIENLEKRKEPLWKWREIARKKVGYYQK